MKKGTKSTWGVVTSVARKSASSGSTPGTLIIMIISKHLPAQKDNLLLSCTVCGRTTGRIVRAFQFQVLTKPERNKIENRGELDRKKSHKKTTHQRSLV